MGDQVEHMKRDAITRYCDHMNARSLAKMTIHDRRVALRRTERALGKPIIKATRDELRQWASDRTQQVSVITVRGEISTVRCFFAWALDEGLRSDDPSRRLPAPRAVRRVPRPMPEADYGQAMEQADDATRAILGLAGMAGLRACEIAGLAWAEVDLAAASLTVTSGKGGHGRTIPVPQELVSILAALPHRRGPVIRRLDGGLGHVAPHRISQRANSFLHSIGVRSTLHCLRHRAGTRAYAATLDQLAVRDLLGHVSLSTTSGYVAIASTSIRAAADALGEIAS